MRSVGALRDKRPCLMTTAASVVLALSVAVAPARAQTRSHSHHPTSWRPTRTRSGSSRSPPAGGSISIASDPDRPRS